MVQNEEEYHKMESAFLKVALDAVISMDSQGCITEFNPSAEKLFGYSRQEALGREMAELIIPESFREAHRNGLNQFLKHHTGQIIDKRLELSALRRDGSEFPVELTVTVMQKNPLIFTGFIRDITEKKQAEDILKRSQQELEVLASERRAALVLSEQRFRVMIGNIKDYAIYLLDPEGRVLSWNEGVKRITGYEAAEIIGQHFSKFYIEGDRIRGKPAHDLREAFQTGRAEDEGYRVRKDGTVFWANRVLTTLRDESNKLIGYSIITKDLTEKKRHEDKLRQMRDELKIQVEEQTKELLESRDQLDIILRGISDGISVMDEHGDFSYVNESGARICGYATPEKLLNTPTSEIMKNFEFRNESGETMSLEKLPVGQVLKGKNSTEEMVLRFRLKDTGEEKWLLFRSSPVFDQNKKMRLAVSIFKDFTERKRIEDSIKYLDEASRVLASSLDYEQTLSAIAKMAISHIADWCLVYAVGPNSPAPHTLVVEHAHPGKKKLLFEIMKKYPPEENERRVAARVFRTGQSELFTDIPNELLEALSATKEHLALIKKLGLGSLLCVPLISRGQVFGALTLVASESGRRYSREDLVIAEELARRGGVAIDNALLFAEIEEEKKQHQIAHEKMEKLAVAAESASEVKSLFLANMSHEIRTPLGAILGFTDLLSDPELSAPERKKYSDIIERNGRQLTQLIDDILDLSKVEAGHLDIETIKLSLPALLTDIMTALKFRANEKGLSFEMITEENAPDVICSDPTRLRQILMNIVGNAIKFTESGGVKVSVSGSGPDKRKVIFSVEDTGLGISKENRLRLFEWFTQADSSTTRKFGGTGLGLALSRRLARALGGDIWLDESRKSGSRFIISILNRNQAGESCEVSEGTKIKAVSQAETAESESRLKGVRVLVVEDSPDNRMLIESILLRHGVLVETAEDGREGVTKALSGNYDVILMDIQMPVFDGIQATMELRRKNYKKPIVALTAHAMKEEREKTLAIGCDAHLTKPLVVSKLLNVIAEFARSRV